MNIFLVFGIILTFTGIGSLLIMLQDGIHLDDIIMFLFFLFIRNMFFISGNKNLIRINKKASLGSLFVYIDNEKVLS